MAARKRGKKSARLKSPRKLTRSESGARTRSIIAKQLRDESRLQVSKPVPVKASKPKRDTVPSIKKSLAERRKLLREYRKPRVPFKRRDAIIKRVNKLRDFINAERQERADEKRAHLIARERVKALRPYVEGYDAAAGFDLRSPDQLTGKQLRRIEKDYLLLVPVLSRPHVKVAARGAKRRKVLASYQGLQKLPTGTKAIPITTYSPDSTKVEVSADGVVTKRTARHVERSYFFTPAEKKQIKRTGDVETATRDLLARMPAGRYFAVTGEHEAFQNTISHYGPDTAYDPDNLAFKQVQEWIAFYPEAGPDIWFRGFRWIGTLKDAEAGRRERRRIIKHRTKMQKVRKEKLARLAWIARKRAAAEVPKK